MTTLSVEQQIAQIRPIAGLAANMHKWLLGGAAVGVLAAILLWHPWPLMIGAFLGLVGFAGRRNGHHVATAVLAYDSRASTHGEVSIAVDSSDTVNRYTATVREPRNPDWEYSFIPVGWQPDNGVYPARIWRTSVGKAPVLSAVENGILIPRFAPQQTAQSNPQATAGDSSF